MELGKGFVELGRVASDYIQGGMGKQGSYAAVRNARSREAERDKEAPAKKPDTTPGKPEPVLGDATPHVEGGAELV